MKKIDFMFTIGFQGVSAIVDKRAKNQYGKLSGIELAEKGLFKTAFCGALYDDDTSGLEEIVKIYNRISGESFSTVDSMKRLLGVFGIPENISKVVYI